MPSQSPSFDVTASERKDIQSIAKRAVKVMKADGFKLDTLNTVMDLTATHANGCRLDLPRLLQADNFNLIHDVLGIARHLDRDTGKLTDCFVPRFAAREQVSA